MMTPSASARKRNKSPHLFDALPDEDSVAEVLNAYGVQFSSVGEPESPVDADPNANEFFHVPGICYVAGQVYELI